jgi:MoaA/NifB/PqqE/SkfB family radical SAM enzyme
MYIMNIRGMDFLLTFKCPSQCKHCSYRAGPKQEGCMNSADMEMWLAELVDTQPIRSCTFHGGEPFLYFEILKEGLEKARERGIHERWVITNGYWAETRIIAEEKLRELKEYGLTCITFSVDAFHQEYIPFDNVKTGLVAATQLGFDTIAVDSYYIVSKDYNDTYNKITTKVIDNLNKLPGVDFFQYPISFEGRAADYLTEDVQLRQGIPGGRCRFPRWLGGDYQNPQTVEIDYEGNVTLCPGICIGNAKKRFLTDVIENYDYRNHPIMRIVAEEGPLGLFKLAEAKGYKGARNFVNECHLCYEVRRFLRTVYPQYLTPAGCYEEMR